MLSTLCSVLCRWPLPPGSTAWLRAALWFRAGLLLAAFSWLTSALSLPVVASVAATAPSHIAQWPIYRPWLSILASADKGAAAPIAARILEPYWQWCDIFSARERVEYMADPIDAKSIELCGRLPSVQIDQKSLDELHIYLRVDQRARKRQSASLK